MDSNKKKKPSKAELEKQYFREARSWDEDKNFRIKQSERNAWRIVAVLSVISALLGIGIASLAPLKTVEPFVIRVDNNTGVVDVVSNLAETSGSVDESAQEVLDKYWLSKYIRNREAYQWETKDYNRNVVGLMSSASVQQEYAAYTDPRQNPRAPVSIYGNTAEVEVKWKGTSFINKNTALVRYTKQVKQAGKRSNITHWAATITYAYLNSPMSIEDRLINPLGFQVLNYRNDQESIGE